MGPRRGKKFLVVKYIGVNPSCRMRNPLISTLFGGWLQMWEDLEGDRLHVLGLVFLYFLQGIPMGLDHAIPLILTRRNVPYSEQATFSISTYPFSMKVLWAPIVDSLFWERFGRRKSWLIPMQYLIGIVMLVSSLYVNPLLGDSSISSSFNMTDVTNSSLLDEKDNIDKTVVVPDVPSLTAMFFVLYFLAATQDIAVDGWAITMLRPENVGYASTCNVVGLTTGWSMAYVVFTTLEARGIMDLSQFLLILGIIFLVTTTTIAIFKKEKSMSEIQESPEVGTNQELDLGLIEAYKMLWRILWSQKMLIWIIFQLTATFGFSAAENIFKLKLVEFGVPRESIAELSLPMIPVKILTVLVVSRYTVGSKPLNVWLCIFPIRLITSIGLTILVYVTPMLRLENGSFPSYFYILLTCLFGLFQMTMFSMSVSWLAFGNKISDPMVGGTYITILNTFFNIGMMWPKSFSLWFIDQITLKQCEPESETLSSSWTSSNNTCHGTLMVEQCKEAGGDCVTVQEGFYTMSSVWLAIGCLWFVWVFRALRYLQSIPPREWRVVNKLEKKEEEEREMDNQEKFKIFYFF